MTKLISIFCLLWCVTMFFWYIQNQGIAIGFDHGIYAHMVNVLEKVRYFHSVPEYIKQQYEPFSGTFFYSLSQFIGKESIYSWGYLVINILCGFAILLLGKNKRYYTLSSLLGLFLFLFSTLQYFNLIWSFGKQLFATFFLLLLLRYKRNTAIGIILSISCILLHRMTGFIAIVFILIDVLTKPTPRRIKNHLWFLLLVALGTLPYFLENTFSYLIYPLLRSHDYFMLSGSYGTGLSKQNFLYYEMPLILILFLGCIHFLYHNSIKKISRNPYLILCLFISGIVLVRSLGHSRLQSFVDLFLIIAFIKLFSYHIHRKWVLILVITQVLLWSTFSFKYHQAFVSPNEITGIKNITAQIPENVSIFSFSAAYNAWLSKYTDREIYSTQQGIGPNLWSYKQRRSMEYNSGDLCKNLEKISGEIVIYDGSKEGFPSLTNNPCLEEVITWNHGARALRYIRSK